MGVLQRGRRSDLADLGSEQVKLVSHLEVIQPVLVVKCPEGLDFRQQFGSMRGQDGLADFAAASFSMVVMVTLRSPRSTLLT
jgi:hypothetical protein